LRESREFENAGIPRFTLTHLHKANIISRKFPANLLPLEYLLLEKPEKILIVRLSALGDVVRCLPALTALRTAFPEAHIGWAIEKRFADLVEGHPDIDETIILPRKDWTRRLKNPLRIPALLVEVASSFRSLRKKSYDVAVDFQGNLRSGIVTGISGARRRIGFAASHAREHSHKFYTECFSPPLGTHRLMWNMLMLSKLGIENPAVVWRTTQNTEETAHAKEFLGRLDSSGPVVIIHPGTSRFGTFKRWPPERFAGVAKRLRDELGAVPVLTGGPGERELCEEVAGLAQGSAAVAPQMSLRRLAALIAEASLFVGADTGPLHIAVAAGVPVVAIFGPKDPAKYGPFGENCEVVTADLPCRPCTRRRCDRADCMTAITVDMVFESAKKNLARG